MDTCSGDVTTSTEETFLQDFLENLEDMFPLYYMHSDVFIGFFNQNKIMLRFGSVRLI